MSLFPHVAFAAMSDIGRKRKNNEDACYASPSYGVWVVSDGMGGGDDGEVASLATVQGVDKFVKAHPFPSGGTWNIDDLVKGLARAASDSSGWIYARAREKHLKGCGATFVALLLDAANPEEAVALHAGDSRLYRIRGRSIQQITKDHSAAAMIGAKNESEINPMFRGMILRAVGIQPTVELERTALPLKPGDWVLICSDGLSRMVPDKTITSIVREVETPDDGVRKLISAANEAGGIDNITAVLVKVGDFPPPVAAFPLALEERPAPSSAPITSDSKTGDTSESMTFGSESAGDPVTGSVTESAMTFDEAILDDDDAKTRETSVTVPLVQECDTSIASTQEHDTPAAVVQEHDTSAAVVQEHDTPAAVVQKHDTPAAVVQERGLPVAEPRRRNILVMIVLVAFFAALLAAAGTWYICMRAGVGGATAETSGDGVRQTE